MSELTSAQMAVLNKMEVGIGYSAYSLQCSLSTLNALVRRNLVSSHYGLGSMAFPRTSIKFSKL